MSNARNISLWAVFVALAFTLVFTSRTSAQTPNPANSGALQNRVDTSKGGLKIKETRPGVDLPDSLYVSHDSVKGDIDTVVRYSAKDSTVFDVDQKRMTLVNNAVMQFQNRELDAYTIVMDFQENTLRAYSYDYDSVISSSLALRRRIIRDTNRVKTRGAPILHEGTTPYEGEVIVYNFKTKRGTVQLGTSEMEGGFYYGEKIKQVAPQTLFIQNGRYTTCDAPVPHYYFESPKMKVVSGEQVFAEPVVLYVADVPIFALPFGVFPNHGGGRHSGIIVPSYQTGQRGYGLTHLGYFEVFNDYLDAAVRSDIYTKGGYNVDGVLTWMQRYLLNSAADVHVGYGYSRFSSADPFQKNWLIEGSLPNLALGWTSSLSANLRFASSSYFQNNAHSVADLLTQQVTSNASYNTQWEDLGMSLGVQYSRSQNLLNGSYQEQSPSINFSKSTFYPFQPSDGAASNSLLSTLGLGYSLSASRSLTRDANTPVTTDTTRWTTNEQYGILHSPSISISPHLGHFTFSPSFNYQEAWFVRSHRRIPMMLLTPDTNGKIDTVISYRDSTVGGFNRAYDYSFGAGVSTTLYGIANIGIGGLDAIRHTLMPSLNFTYHPDLASQSNGFYHDPKTDTLTRYNIFDGEPNGGLGSAGRSAVFGFSLGNDFEAKVERQVTKDSSTKDKIKLLDANIGTGYDVVQQRWSPVGLSAYSTIGSKFHVSTTAGFSLYPLNSTGGDSTLHTLLALRQGILRPTNVSFSLDGSFASTETTEGENYDSLRHLVNITSPDDERQMLIGGYFPGTYVNVPFRPKWNLSYGVSYQQYFLKDTTTRDVSANLNLSFSITKNWSLSSSASYDFNAGKIVIPSITLHRDLHCWEMNLNYRPPGSLISGYNFEIRIKAEQLQDVKLTRTENSYGEF